MEIFKRPSCLRTLSKSFCLISKPYQLSISMINLSRSSSNSHFYSILRHWTLLKMHKHPLTPPKKFFPCYCWGSLCKSPLCLGRHLPSCVCRLLPFPLLSHSLEERAPPLRLPPLPPLSVQHWSMYYAVAVTNNTQ